MRNAGDIEALADRTFAPIAALLDAGRIPGAVFGVAMAGGRRGIRHAGFAQIEPAASPMAADTIFDLASLTKVVFTTTTILQLADAGRLSLDDPLSQAIPDLRQYDIAGAAERRLTIRDCLTHRTHLPAVEPLYTYGQDPATLRALVLQREWRAGPPVYSDINFILLGILIERLTGRPLGEQRLLPGFSFRPDPARCAATERCSWRGRVMRGEVHDENAFALGGAAGHAGLFGTADALLDFATGLLEGRLLSDEARADMLRRQSETRALGWEVAHPGWSGGDLCGEGVVGHTGFTGTGLWIDPAAGLAWTLLTNRVHPTRHADSGIFALRRAVGDILSAG